MKNHHNWPTGLRAFLLLSALIPNCVSAKYLHIPFTPLEQMSTLSHAASRATVHKLFRPGTGKTMAGLPHQRDYRIEYLSPSLGHRNTIAEKIGEEGAVRYATERKWKMLLGPQVRNIHLGPDLVFWDPKTGTVRVLEAKGGSSARKWTYGSLQGTNTNTIRSAEGLLRKSGASRTERLEAARTIKAAQKGHLVTMVVKTPHVQGRPDGPPQQVGSSNTENVAKEARQIERELVRRDPGLRRVFLEAGFRHKVGRLNYHGQRIGQAAGRWFLVPSMGVRGVSMMTTYYRFYSGSIGSREFYRSSAGPAAGIIFTVTGAIVGSVAFGIGAAAGASFGAIAGVPAEFAIEWVVDQYYGDFDLRQRRLVDAAVEEFYGVDAVLVGES